MHPILDQMKSVLHHAEAFEDEVLRRFGLKLLKHGHDKAWADHIYSLVDPEGECFGCRAMLGEDQAWFEVFYEDNNEIGNRAYSIVVAYRPANDRYTLDLEVSPAGLDEVAAVLGADHAPVDGERAIDGDEYNFIIASMAQRFSRQRR